MEINVNKLLDHRLEDYSDSVFNSGMQNIGRITWNNAVNCDLNFVSEDNKEEFIDYFAEFGAWSLDEIKAWSLDELNGLFIQLVSGDMQTYLDAESKGIEAFNHYQETQGGHLYKADDDQFYYYVGM